MKRKFKILIHIIYWFYMINQFLYPWYINKTESYFWMDTALNLVLSLINFYAFYFILPFLIKNRNIPLSIFTGAFFLFIIAVARYYIEVFFWKEIIHLPQKEMLNIQEWFYAGLRLSIISGAYAILIKFAIDVEENAVRAFQKEFFLILKELIKGTPADASMFDNIGDARDMISLGSE